MTYITQQVDSRDFGVTLPRELVYFFARGNMDLLDKIRTSIAVVGARASTGYGEHVTMDLVTQLVEQGNTIASTSDYGIGGMALRASLASNSAPIVFMSGGTDRLYPSGHDALLQRVLGEGGLLVSLNEDGHSPTKQRILDRNVFMGLSVGAVLATEAGWRSGSLRVAEVADQAGTPVYATPGPITSASSSGSNNLIKTGVATLLDSVSDLTFLRMS